jgi:predicted HTH transcriptional regulator
VESFLDGETVEPLTWEGKAADLRGRLERRDIVKTVAAFANSERGGYLVLGARTVNGA